MMENQSEAGHGHMGGHSKSHNLSLGNRQGLPEEVIYKLGETGRENGSGHVSPSLVSISYEIFLSPRGINSTTEDPSSLLLVAPQHFLIV